MLNARWRLCGLNQVGNRTVQHRRRPVERNANDRQQYERSLERQRQQRHNAKRGHRFCQPHRRDNANAGTDEGTDQLAGRATGKHQSEREADGLQTGALCGEHERQKCQKRHARGAVDDANREQQRKAISAGNAASMRLTVTLALERLSHDP